MTEETAALKPLWGYMNGRPLRIPVIGVAGEHGSGKSLFGLLIDPENTICFDLEESSVSYNIHLKKRYDLYQEVGIITGGRIPKPIECFLWFRDRILEIKPGEYRVCQIDPITDIEQGMVDYIRENPTEFGYTANQFERGAGLLWAAVNAYWKIFIGLLTHRFETVVFTAHMRNVWKGGQPTDKREAKGKSCLEEIASVYMRVERKPIDRGPRQGETPDKPVAYFGPPPYKCRLASMTIDKETGDLYPHPLFPPRMVECCPAKWREYIAKGVDYRNLKEDEKIIEQPLTEDQKLELQAKIASDKRAASEAELEKHRSLQDAAREMTAQQAARREQAQREAAEKSAAEAVKQIPIPSTLSQKPEKADAVQKPREEIENGIRQLFRVNQYDAPRAVAKIKEFSPEASKLSEMAYDEAVRLLGFLTDATSMQMHPVGK